MESLIKLFDIEDRIEAQQRTTGKNINEMNLDYHGSVIPKIPVNDFLKRDLFISISIIATLIRLLILIVSLK